MTRQLEHRPSSTNCWTRLVCMGAAASLALGTLRSVGCATSPQPLSPREAAASSCAECHQEIAREWRGSAHARAWDSKTFVEASAGHTRAACLSCHAPAGLVDGGAPRLRDWRREDGVDCQACHLDDDGVVVGPLDAERPGLLQAHLVRRDALFFRSTELCGRCHGVTLEQVTTYSRAPERDGLVPTCQQCHMQPVMRGLTQGGGVVTELGAAAAEETRQRRHDFALTLEGWTGDEKLELQLDLQRQADPILAVARLQNGLPHGLPTGNEFSQARVQLSLHTTDANGKTTPLREETFTPPGLPADASHELSAELPAGTRRVTVTVTRTRPGHPDQVLAKTTRDLDR